MAMERLTAMTDALLIRTRLPPVNAAAAFRMKILMKMV
jgi:hypothetical protein